MAPCPNANVNEYGMWRQAFVWISLFAKCEKLVKKQVSFCSVGYVCKCLLMICENILWQIHWWTPLIQWAVSARFPYEPHM